MCDCVRVWTVGFAREHDMTWCDVMRYDVMWCDVMWCDVRRWGGWGWDAFKTRTHTSKSGGKNSVPTNPKVSSGQNICLCNVRRNTWLRAFVDLASSVCRNSPWLPSHEKAISKVAWIRTNTVPMVYENVTTVLLCDNRCFGDIGEFASVCCRRIVVIADQESYQSYKQIPKRIFCVKTTIFIPKLPWNY